MGIYIKGMKMPKACYECRMYEADIYYCTAAERDIDIPSSDEGRCSFCPLIELPDHGDLIDRDALNATDSWEWIRHGAPVVIPAERREDGFDGDTWHDLNGATAAPSGMKWQSNGKSRFSSEYAHRLVKKDTGAEKAAKMRLIDADALIEHLRKDPLFPLVERYGITGVIEAAPTIGPEQVADLSEYSDRLWKIAYERGKREAQLPSAQPEPLTDKEQRIFLAAMGREEKVCKEIDAEMTREPYEDSLVRVCREIERKVKGSLWT